MRKTIYTLENMQRLLEFCLYEAYEKENKDFDLKRYLDFINDRLKILSSNEQKENATN